MRAVRRADRMLVIAMKATDRIVTMTTVDGVRTTTSYRGAVGVLNGLTKVSKRRLRPTPARRPTIAAIAPPSAASTSRSPTSWRGVAPRVSNDSNLPREEIPAVQDAKLLFIPGDVLDSDEGGPGPVERPSDRASERGRGPEEAADRDVKARDRLVSGDVVRTVRERRGAALGDVRLPREVLAQRGRTPGKRKRARGHCEPVEKRR